MWVFSLHVFSVAARQRIISYYSRKLLCRILSSSLAEASRFMSIGKIRRLISYDACTMQKAFIQSV